MVLLPVSLKNTMKTTSFILLVGIALTQSCSNGPDKTQTNDSITSKEAQSTLNTPDTTQYKGVPVDKESTDFAVAAANGGLMEVELGAYARDNASNQQVKDFGSMMVTDHSKANEELKRIALPKNIILPTMVEGKEKKHMDELMKKKGKDFDKAYVSMMIEDHKIDVSEFEKASKKLPDAALKNFATLTLPVLERHYSAVKAIKL